MRPPVLAAAGNCARVDLHVRQGVSGLGALRQYWGKTVPNGRPIIDETRELTSFFSCPPSREPEVFEKLSLDGDRSAFLFVVLIGEAERAYAWRTRTMVSISVPARVNLGISS